MMAAKYAGCISLEEFRMLQRINVIRGLPDFESNPYHISQSN